MKIEIKLFANLREKANKKTIKIEIEKNETVKKLLEKLVDKYPSLKEEIYNNGEISNYINITLNGKEIDPNDKIEKEGEIAIFPPVSGGFTDKKNSKETSHPHHNKEIQNNKINFSILTVSSSRDKETDKSGKAIIETIKEENFSIHKYHIIDDDKDIINKKITDLVNSKSHIIITTGGTGITKDDVTIEAIKPLFDKELPGFGELFRRISYNKIGTSSIMTRSTAGIIDNTAIFLLPGNKDGAKLGVKKIILEQTNHIVNLLSKNQT